MILLKSCAIAWKMCFEFLEILAQFWLQNLVFLCVNFWKYLFPKDSESFLQITEAEISYPLFSNDKLPATKGPIFNVKIINLWNFDVLEKNILNN